MRLFTKAFVLAAILSLASTSLVAAASPTATSDGRTALRPFAWAALRLRAEVVLLRKAQH